MKPLFIKEKAGSDNSFMLKRKEFKYFPVKFHYHSELELVLKVNSTGKMIVGNYVGRFQKCNLFLLGENLPHYWKNDEVYYHENDLKAVSIVAHFDKNFGGKDLLLIPEMKNIVELFEKAKRGMFFGAKTTHQAVIKLEKLLEFNGFKRFWYFLELLNMLATSNDYVFLSTEGFIQGNITLSNSEPLKKAYEYVMMNFKEEISQTLVAEKVGMNVSAFSRFFHKSTKKTFSQFVNEVRLSHVCRLMMENELNICQIAYECGYKNLSNFNNQFKAVFNQTPSKYKSYVLNKKK